MLCMDAAVRVRILAAFQEIFWQFKTDTDKTEQNYDGYYM